MASKGKKGPKTAGASPEEIVQAAVTAEVPRLIPCNEGRNVYYFDPLARTTFHIKTEELADFVADACALGLYPRIVAELEGFIQATDNQEAKERWSEALMDIAPDAPTDEEVAA